MNSHNPKAEPVTRFFVEDWRHWEKECLYSGNLVHCPLDFRLAVLGEMGMKAGNFPRNSHFRWDGKLHGSASDGV